MDYSKLGLKVGLEIHQQLASKNKLFCNCPVDKSEDFPGVNNRKLRAVSGELGDFDPAALYEFLKGKTFVYKSNYDTSCLVELDESPPLEMNREALEIVIQACKLLKCKIVDEVHVMRKTVIDGSAVSGFQRTSVIAHGGYINTKNGKIGIETVCLEEDSSPAISKGKDNVEYRIDRLGTPLIEIATEPAIHSPEHAKEVAQNIGMLLRSLKVVRGIGSIRQDVNISIKNGSRIEIKGFQELEKIPNLVENEVKRQVALLEIKKELQKRGLKKIDSNYKDVTKLFSKTQSTFIRKALNKKEKILALVLPKFNNLLRKEVGDRTFGKELSGYAGAYGYGIIHSDEHLDKYKLSSEFSKLKKEFNAKEHDLILIVVGEDPEIAVNSVLERAKYCLIGVPEETRIADGEGSKYTRPLPGSRRMYPETDVPPVRMDKKMLSVKLPKTLLEREKELSKKLSIDMAKQMVSSEYFSLFDEFTKDTKVDPIIIANMFLSSYKDLKRDGYDLGKIDNAELLNVLKLIENKTIDKKALYDSLLLLIQNKTVKDVEKRFSLMDESELKKILAFVIKENPDKNDGALMGISMSQLKGRASGEQVAKMLKKLKK